MGMVGVPKRWSGQHQTRPDQPPQHSHLAAVAPSPDGRVGTIDARDDARAARAVWPRHAQRSHLQRPALQLLADQRILALS